MSSTRIRTAIAICMVIGVMAIILSVARHPGPPTATHAAQGDKKLWHCGMHPQVVQDHPGDCPICHMALTPMGPDKTAGDMTDEKKVLYWWDPMLGPSSISDHPGKSAMGMDMVPVYPQAAGPEVQIDSAVVQNMGVRTETVTRGPLARTLRTVGSVSLPEPGMHDVSLKVSGWIDKLYANQDGMHIVAGDPLFDLYSPELQVAAQELIGATAALKALGPQAQDTSRHEVEALVESTKRKLRLWDVAERDIDAIAAATVPPRDIPFRSPATGHVEGKTVVAGSSVQAGIKLLRVADHTRMWLEAEVYEDQFSFVKLGQKVEANFEALPGKTFGGTVDFIYPHVEHATRTLRVRASLDNPAFELRPGMYATVRILSQPMSDVVQTSLEAVVDTGTRQIAFIVTSPGHFAPRLVKIGVVGDDDRVQILSGLAPGETVVTSGQFLMDVESRTIEATQKLTSR